MFPKLFILERIYAFAVRSYIKFMFWFLESVVDADLEDPIYLAASRHLKEGLEVLEEEKNTSFKFGEYPLYLMYLQTQRPTEYSYKINVINQIFERNNLSRCFLDEEMILRKHSQILKILFVLFDLDSNSCPPENMYKMISTLTNAYNSYIRLTQLHIEDDTSEMLENAELWLGAYHNQTLVKSSYKE
jgi:hypothetical protein